MPSTHTAVVQWQRQPDETFTDQGYSRRHEWRFDGGAAVAASSSPARGAAAALGPRRGRPR